MQFDLKQSPNFTFVLNIPISFFHLQRCNLWIHNIQLFIEEDRTDSLRVEWYEKYVAF
jgi:lipoprotein NlpI